jgi:dGTPase
MRTRQDIEALEEQTLAPYAMKSKDSAGRVYNEPQHAWRTCYQRDRDRIVHSEHFRKLEYKTQVFSIFEADYYRTRLTHTLEVAQIGRTIGRNLRLNEDLIEAIALAHDLGHPPFGHAGEEALDSIMQQTKAGGFNHNKRSFEIVSKYEKRYPEFNGLNLTREVLIGILKHQTVYDQASETMGYHEGPTLEAQAVDFADSLAYLNHDVDDGLKAGCITVKDLRESALSQKALQNIKGSAETDDLEMLRYQVVKQLIDMQVKDLLQETDRRLEEFHFASAQEVRDSGKTVFGFSEKMKKDRDFLQGLLNEKLYHHHRVVRMTSKAKRIIQDLFRAYANEPNQLPPADFPRNRSYTEEEKIEVLCNYIASMTDRFALEEHKKLFNSYTKV